jgi:hypothetical protein
MKNTWDGCKLSMKRQGQARVVDADCPSPLLPAKAKTEITGDFQSSYTIRTEATLLGPIKDLTLTTQTANWKSADCAGMAPGDISVAPGIKVNVKQLKLQSGAKRPTN